MNAIASAVTFLVSFVLVFQPAIEIVLRQQAQNPLLVGVLEPFTPASASAALPPGAIPLPSPLRLTRTQSAYSIDTTTGGEITLSYHAVNLGTEDTHDLLLVTTLAAGATLIDSTPAAEVSGQTVAIVLPSVLPGDRATATVRVALPSGAAPLAIDEGASVFGSLQTREVADTIGSTVLPQSVGVDPSLLAPTPDAMSDDVDTQRYVAEVGCDGGDIFRFVRDEIEYEAYRGSLRGSRGTLWSMAGNALDQASVLIAMLRSCGIPARYATGTLDVARSQELIGSMFAEPLGIVGGLDPAEVPGLDAFDLYGVLSDAVLDAPGADEISDPENDADLLETASRHAWVELWDGGGFVAADPTFAGSNIGDTFASTSQTFSEIPDSMRHKVRFQLVEEEYPVDAFNNILAAAYHLDPSDELVRNGVKPVGDVFVHEIPVLEHTLPTVSLVGEPVSFGHFVQHDRCFSTVEFIFNTYKPWMQVGRDGELIRGTDYQEAMATIVLDLAKIVTGLFVRMTTIDPDGNETLYEHVYHDRFGLAQRVGEEPIGAPDLSGEPIVNDVTTIDISVPVSDIHPRVATEAFDRSRAATFELNERFPTAPTDDLSTYSDEQMRDVQQLSRDAVREVSRFDLATLSNTWDRVMRDGEAYTGTRTYLAEPQLFVAATYARERGGSQVFGKLTDLRKYDFQAIPYPGERMSTAWLARAISGLLLTVQETASLFRQADPAAPAFGAIDIISASAQQGIGIRMIGSGNQLEVDELDVSAEARARIRRALANDKTVMVPSESVTIDGTATTAWLEVDMATGDTIGVGEHGGHVAAIDYAAILTSIGLGFLGFFGDLLGAVAGLLGLYLDLQQKAKQCQNRNSAACGVLGQKALGVAVLGGMCTFVVGGLAALFIVGGPLGWLGYLMVATVCAIGLYFYNEQLNNLANDPQLSARGTRFFARTRASWDAEAVSATATLPSGPGAVTGTIDAAHARADGELDAAHLADPTDGPLALFPAALPGLGAGGANGFGLNFDGSILATAVGSDLSLDYDSGSLSITGDTLAGPANVGFTGFDGAIDATDAGATDTVVTDGTYDRVLFVELDSSNAAAGHDAPASFQTTIHSNADDDYGLTAQAPAGWSVDVTDTGLVTFEPPFGAAAGSYEVRIVAHSGSLVAEAIATIDVVATVPGALGVSLVEDPVFNVPQHGTLAFTNYRLEVFNAGLVDDIFDVAISGPPAADFTLAAPSIFVPAGETGFVGVALHPAGGLLPAGTPVSLTGTATGRGTGLSGNASATFTYPEVYGVVPAFVPDYIFGNPGDSIAVDLSLTGTGNGPSAFTLDVINTEGLGVSGIPASETVGAGATSVLPVTVTIPPGASPGTPATISVVADLCNGSPLETCTVPQPSTRNVHLAVSIGAPEAACLFDAARRSVDGADPTVARKAELFGRALSALSLDPANIGLQSRALAAGNEILLFLVAADLQNSSTELSALLAEIASGDEVRVADAVSQLCTTLAALPSEMEAEADTFNYGFTLGFSPASVVVTPGSPAVYDLRITSIGTQTTSIELSLANLPAGVTGALSQTSVTLAPGEVVGENSAAPITATLSSPTPITGAPFDVEGFVTSKPAIAKSATALFAAVEAAIDITVVTSNPTAVEAAGAPADVTVELLNRVNQPRDVIVTWRVEDPTGALLFTGTPTPAHLGTGGGTTSVPVGTIDTTGFADGNHNIIAQVTTPTGDSIQGREGRGVVFVGLPFSAYAMVAPALVPPASTEAVTSSVVVAPSSVTQIGDFADQFADAVASSTSVTGEDNAIGPPDGDVAVLPFDAEIIVDMGAGGQRIGDGVGDDLVIFERDPAACTTVHEFQYEVAVGNSATGPFTVLGTASGERLLGDGFDLAGSGLAAAQFVRIRSQEDEIGIDAVLAAHTVSPRHIQMEHHSPNGFESGVASTPVIGDIDEDGRPEVIYTSQTTFSQCEAIGIDGETKAEDFRITYASGCNGGLGSCFCGNSSSAALGDIDNDGSPEVVLYQTVLNNRRIRGFDADGTEILSFEPFNNGSSINPILENLDADPEPEILWPGGFTDLDGTAGLNQAVGGQPVAVDIDDDGALELIMRINWGYLRAFETDGTQIWSASLAGLTANFSRAAVADLNDDGGPNLVVVHQHDFGTQRKMTALDATDGSVLWENTFPDALGTCAQGGELCGPGQPPCSGLFNSCSTVNLSQDPTTPTIADLDGDGDPEIATFIRRWVGLEDHVVAFERDGTFMWSTEASDPGGTPPGISSADLNGDGSAEVIWNGWCDGFTILDGATGAILYRDPRAASASGGDHATIGDIDNDGHAEIATGGVDGLYIFGADLDWGPARAVWNHIDYHVTNVEDDLTIPTSKAPHWPTNNTYRSQTAVGFGGASASVLITHDLGATFAFNPGDITPAPSQVNGVVEWDETLTGLGSFDVPGTVPALAPGESTVVSDSSTVEGTLTLEGGAVVNLSIPLGPTTVTAPHIIGLTPEVQTASAGTEADFTVHLENLRTTSETFSFSIIGFDPGAVTIAPSVLVGAGSTVDVPLSLSTRRTSPAGLMDFLVVATGDQGTIDQVFGSVAVTPNENLPATVGGVLVEVDPPLQTAGKGSTGTVNVIVTNTGSRTETFNLGTIAADGIAGTFADPALTVSPGLGASRTTQLVLEVPPTAPTGSRAYEVTATAQSNPALVGSTTATLEVPPYGILVELSPDTATVTPGGGTTLTAKLTNPGTGTARLNLEALGQLGPYACFETVSGCNPDPFVSLFGGRETTIDITIDNVPNFPQQTAIFGVKATANNIINGIEVADMDYALIDILGSRDIGLEVEPTSITEDSLAPIPFHLRITNAGNLCDERYTMTFTSDPVGVDVTPETTSFVVPGGSTALVGAYALPPAFGTFTIHVDVETETANSLCPSAAPKSASADLTLIVNGTNVGPVADAGPNQSVEVGTSASLDGTGSFDPDGGGLSFVWTFQSLPPGSALTTADIVGANTAAPSFTPDVPGDFVVALDVSDGQLNDGDTTTVTATAAPSDPPIADAGPDQQVVTGDLTKHDGSASYDPDGDLITFAWTVLSVPGGSAVTGASLSDPADAKPTFTPDVDGDYEFEVTVTDGVLSDTDTVVITAAPSNVAPVAEAGPNEGTLSGTPVTLDGRGSFDPDAGPSPLTHLWAILDKPVGSTLTDADIVDRSNAVARFTPDVIGTFVIGLAVSDGDRTSTDEKKVLAGSNNIPPVADAGTDVLVILGGIPTLDGGGSRDGDNGPSSPLTFSWRFVARPAGSTLTDADLRDADTEAPSFTPDAVGTFVVRLTVFDGLDTHEDNVAIEVDRRPGMQPAADVWLRRGSRAINEGASAYLVIRGNTSRALIKFDTADILAELDGQELASAHLELTINGPDAQGWKNGKPLNAYRMNAPWTEGNGFHYRVRPHRNRTRGVGAGATWWCGTDIAIENGHRECAGTDWHMKPPPRNNSAGIVNPWDEPPTDSVTIQNQQTGTVLFDVTADVAAFLSGAPNHGWAILKEPKTGGGTLWLDSSEGPAPPRLVIVPK